MKPDWDKLGDEYAASSSVVIADVDCTADGDELCNEFGIQGYPTIKYFMDGEDGQDYQSGRDFESLKAFVEEELEAKCDVASMEGCSEKEKSYITKMAAKGSTDRVEQIKRLTSLATNPMKAELKLWVRQRLHILKSLEAKEEL